MKCKMSSIVKPNEREWKDVYKLYDVIGLNKKRLQRKGTQGSISTRVHFSFHFFSCHPSPSPSFFTGFCSVAQSILELIYYGLNFTILMPHSLAF